jgi:hypothetical protein
MSTVGANRTVVPTEREPTGIPQATEVPVGAPRQFPHSYGLRAIALVSVLLLHMAWVSGIAERNSTGTYTGQLEIGVSIVVLTFGLLVYRPLVLSYPIPGRAPNAQGLWTRRLPSIAYWLGLNGEGVASAHRGPPSEASDRRPRTFGVPIWQHGEWMLRDSGSSLHRSKRRR